MTNIYLDESGDLGFDFTKKKTTKYFVITFMFVMQPRPIEKIVKKIFQGFSREKRIHHPGVLHSTKESPDTRKKVLTMLAGKNVSVMTIYLNKQKVYTRLQDEKQVLYNYVTNILLDRVLNSKHVKIDVPVYLVASKRETNKFFNENFRSYLKLKTQKNYQVSMNVAIKTPAEEKCLQIVDFVSWAYFRKREFGDDSYRKIIQRLCVEESPLFP
jgi:hypothetical protein